MAQKIFSASVTPGLDVLREGVSATARLMSGAQLGLLTNHTGRTRDGQSTLDVLREMGCTVAALFSPEHGVTGTREGHIASGRTGDNLPIHSLYGDTRRPTDGMLRGVEVLVCDLQDVGARFYTYASTLAHCMEECAARGIAVAVLDRPNPIGGETVEGPLIDNDVRSFVGYLDIPVRHGMTLGELALLFQNDAGLDLDLHITSVHGWQRHMQWPETRLEWLPPSPNLPDYESAAWYPGTCLLEFSGVSVGRGTEAPFQIIGAPWLDAAKVLTAIAAWPSSVQESFSAQPLKFTPTRGEHQGVLCHGLHFTTPHSAVHTPHSIVPLGLCLLSTLHRIHPQEFNEEKLRAALPLLGSRKVLELLQQGAMDEAISIAAADADSFSDRRRPFLLYD